MPRSFSEDDLARQHLSALGIRERPVEYSADERSDEEKLTDAFLGVLKPGRR